MLPVPCGRFTVVIMQQGSWLGKESGRQTVVAAATQPLQVLAMARYEVCLLTFVAGLMQ